MSSYLMIKHAGGTKSIEAKTAEPAKPYIKVADGYFPLTTETSGTGVFVKASGNTYKIAEKNTITIDTSSSYTESKPITQTVDYSTYDSMVYKKNNGFLTNTTSKGRMHLVQEVRVYNKQFVDVGAYAASNGPHITSINPGLDTNPFATWYKSTDTRGYGTVSLYTIARTHTSVLSTKQIDSQTGRDACAHYNSEVILFPIRKDVEYTHYKFIDIRNSYIDLINTTTIVNFGNGLFVEVTNSSSSSDSSYGEALTLTAIVKSANTILSSITETKTSYYTVTSEV